MPLLILFVLSEQSLGTVANGELVSTEIVRTLVGSIGRLGTNHDVARRDDRQRGWSNTRRPPAT
jgi:hypothetical protein